MVFFMPERREWQDAFCFTGGFGRAYTHQTMAAKAKACRRNPQAQRNGRCVLRLFFSV
jgi:hypothetical protein